MILQGLLKEQVKEKDYGNQFLSHIREVDSICEVVRCFEDSNVVHVDGSISPLRDIETINLELILADIETVDKKIEKAKKMLKADKKYAFEIEVLEKVKKVLEERKISKNNRIYRRRTRNCKRCIFAYNKTNTIHIKY